MLSNVAEHKPRPSLFDGLVRHLQAWCIDACTCSVLVCSARKSNTRALYETVHFVVAQGIHSRLTRFSIISIVSFLASQ